MTAQIRARWAALVTELEPCEEPDLTPHGTAGGYTNHHCRCTPCKAAHRRYQRAWRAKRTA